MIKLFLEKIQQKYLEIHLDDLGCQLFMDRLKLLSKCNEEQQELFDIDICEQKKDFQVISFLSFQKISTLHFFDTDYNIKCSIVDKNTIVFCLSLLGIDELLYIIEYVHSTGEHFHLFGGFDLYTGQGETSFDIINAITIYKS